MEKNQLLLNECPQKEYKELLSRDQIFFFSLNKLICEK